MPEHWGKKSKYTEGTGFLRTPADHLELTAKRPLSPDLFKVGTTATPHYKMPPTALSSIVNRLTGLAMTGGMTGLAAVALAGDPVAAIEAFKAGYPALVLPAKAGIAFPMVSPPRPRAAAPGEGRATDRRALLTLLGVPEVVALIRALNPRERVFRRHIRCLGDRVRAGGRQINRGHDVRLVEPTHRLGVVTETVDHRDVVFRQVVNVRLTRHVRPEITFVGFFVVDEGFLVVRELLLDQIHLVTFDEHQRLASVGAVVVTRIQSTRDERGTVGVHLELVDKRLGVEVAHLVPDHDRALVGDDARWSRSEVSRGLTDEIERQPVVPPGAD